jgi:hypothetical protein
VLGYRILWTTSWQLIDRFPSYEFARSFLGGIAACQARRRLHDTVTILLLLSDGRATTGETNRPKIAEDVYKLNRDGKVKIFSLGFQGNADMELLDAIAIMNGGVTAPILRWLC